MSGRAARTSGCASAGCFQTWSVQFANSRETKPTHGIAGSTVATYFLLALSDSFNNVPYGALGSELEPLAAGATWRT